MSNRPKLDQQITPQDFKDFYWLKEELISFCKKVGLKTSGGKIEIASRISHFLLTGKKDNIITKTIKKNKSTFDWSHQVLTLNTLITDNYSNTENVRSFFINQIGKHFKFNVKFMNWMKSNHGKTLQDACEVWNKILQENRNRTTPKGIAPQFEYNTYLRDFMADNPNEKRIVGIKLWKIKRSKRGDNVYRKEDLKWIQETR